MKRLPWNMSATPPVASFMAIRSSPRVHTCFMKAAKTKKDVRFHDQRCDMPYGTAFSETERWYNY
jgi:hypothetical protein